jgi:hypothetical protein
MAKAPLDLIIELRAALRQALRQWEMYADMVEQRDDFDLKNEKSPEADMYRAAYALAHDLGQGGDGK